MAIEQVNMIIKINDQPLLEITEVMKKVICNDIRSEEYDEDMARRIVHTLLSKYEACFDRLKSEWDPKLAKRGIEMIPTNKEKYAELVFSQPDYKSRTERDNDVSSN